MHEDFMMTLRLETPEQRVLLLEACDAEDRQIAKGRAEHTPGDEHWQGIEDEQRSIDALREQLLARPGTRHRRSAYGTSPLPESAPEQRRWQ